jgi:hypothetical protein
LQIIAVNAGGHVVIVLEHQGRTGVDEQLGVGRDGL